MSQAATQLAVAPPGPVVAENLASAEDELKWKRVASLPCRVSIEVPVPGFTLKSLLGLQPSSVISSQRPTTANLPLRINGELIAWCEFEVLDTRLAVRLTEFA